MRRRGTTILEILIYVILAFMASLAVAALFSLGRAAQKTTLSGYLVSGEADTALRWIRRDLQETSLMAVRVYSNPSGCSFPSPRELSDKEPRWKSNENGKPLWNKHIFYAVRADSDGRRGDLIRWENGMSDAERDFIPRPATLLPGSFSNKTYERTLLHDVVMPLQKIPNLQDRPNYQSDSYGGFRVQFVRRLGGTGGTEELSPISPGDTSQPHIAADQTRLVNVRLQILADDKFKPSFYELEMNLYPRY